MNGELCQFCGKDFKRLQGHIWRCKNKLHLSTPRVDSNHGNINVIEHSRDYYVHNVARSIVVTPRLN